MRVRVRFGPVLQVGLLAAALISGAQASVTTIQPSDRDSYLEEAMPAANHGSEEAMEVGSRAPGQNQRGILHFDLSVLPENSVVISCTLKLYVTGSNGSVREYGVHRIQQAPPRNWVEQEASWIWYQMGFDWTNPGGDFTAQPTATATIGSWSGAGYWASWVVTADAQDFRSNPGTNFGWLVKDESEVGLGTWLRLATRDNATTLIRPKLVVQHTDPTGITLTFFVARVEGDGVVVSWQTEGEHDIAGFCVLRSSSADGEYRRLNRDLIPSHGTDFAGAGYELVDDDGRAGDWYELEVVDLSGGRRTYGPVPAGMSAVAERPVSDEHLLPTLALGSNPARGWLMLRFLSSEPATLAILDAAGRVVRTLAAQVRAPVGRVLVWDGKNDQGAGVRSGTYFSVLHTGKGHLVRKVVFIR